jgi:glucans biosynthesis protein
MPVADIGASAGAIAATTVRRHPDIGGVRVSFELNTGGAETIELRLVLKQAEQTISETWLYRWTV